MTTASSFEQEAYMCRVSSAHSVGRGFYDDLLVNNRAHRNSMRVDERKKSRGLFTIKPKARTVRVTPYTAIMDYVL